VARTIDHANDDAAVAASKNPSEFSVVVIYLKKFYLFRLITVFVNVSNVLI